MLLLIHHLRWDDLCQAPDVLDLPSLRASVERLVLDAGGRLDGPPTDEWREALQQELERTLLAELGLWSAGWCWTATEPGGGGPVRGYCCDHHSLFAEGDESALATVERVVGAVVEWHAFLRELHALFEAQWDRCAELPLAEGLERIAAALLPIVLERTDAQDAWYATFAQLVIWYGQYADHDADRFARALRDVVSGSFHSWCAPDPSVRGTVCRELGLRSAQAAAQAAASPANGLASWLSHRASALQHWQATGARSLADDGHPRFIEQYDRLRGDERADRMHAALTAARRLAAEREALDFNTLCELQAIVLGEDTLPTFRRGEAYAKGGREYYTWKPETQARFEACLAQAFDAREDVCMRAARAYLDVLFFHPFENGNARAARLLVDFILTREGLALGAAAPVFALSRSATDERGPWLLACTFSRLVGRLRTGAS